VFSPVIPEISNRGSRTVVVENAILNFMWSQFVTGQFINFPLRTTKKSYKRKGYSLRIFQRPWPPFYRI